jgi:hypothetical protein
MMLGEVIDRSDRLWGQAILLFNGYGVLPGVKRPGSEVGHASWCGTEVKNEWSVYLCACMPPCRGQRHCDSGNTLCVENRCTRHCGVKDEVQEATRYADLYLVYMCFLEGWVTCFVMCMTGPNWIHHLRGILLIYTPHVATLVGVARI